MRTTIIEDRVLARVARDVVGWDDGMTPAERADIAFGRAVVALRVMGIGVTAEVGQAMRDDIALVIAETADTQSAPVSPAARLAA